MPLLNKRAKHQRIRELARQRRVAKQLFAAPSPTLEPAVSTEPAAQGSGPNSTINTPPSSEDGEFKEEAQAMENTAGSGNDVATPGPRGTDAFHVLMTNADEFLYPNSGASAKKFRYQRGVVYSKGHQRRKMAAKVEMQMSSLGSRRLDCGPFDVLEADEGGMGGGGGAEGDESSR